LQNYIPPFNATVIQKCLQEGAIIIGKTSQDEFGFGGFSTNSGFEIPKNPFDKTRATGGSSGGSAGITQKTSLQHISLAESTGGSIVNPASFCGVYGLCPTYGLVSRYGLIDYASSLDKIGPMAKNIEDIELMLNTIKGQDTKDSTSLNESLKRPKIKKIAIIKESLNVDKEIKDLILQKLEENKIKYDLISLPITQKYGIPTYYLIAMAEASTNLSKLAGLTHGSQLPLKGTFNEYFSEVRSKFFGKEAKRRIILGTFARMSGFRNAYYLKAMKVRTKIIEEYQNAFKKYDLIASPTMPILPPKFSEIEKLTPLQNYMMDILTVGPNLAGLPHLNIPTGFIKKLPVGLLFTSNHLHENNLLKIGKELK
ncbi:Asp-tRNA(Asn)/Glu-tRNA(Gln) amidotransferase GatCAB subunit A, partial [archaeon]|nr:Asp-tRNA(Asn)/Glu-tRNA(Gln) amidotransferase GatCAB subunit A [archaeon]